MATTKREFVAADPEKCVGCSICEYVCGFEKEKVFNPLYSRIRLVRIYPLIEISMACRLCEDPACVTACPRKALTQSEGTGIILVDKDKCNGCGWCIEACEFGAVTLHPKDKTAMICDLCIDEQGKFNPKCVEWCPEEALELVTREILAQKARIATAKKLFREALAEELASSKG